MAGFKNWRIFLVPSFAVHMSLSGGNKHIRIREKMLEFSSTVLSTLPYN